MQIRYSLPKTGFALLMLTFALWPTTLEATWFYSSDRSNFAWSPDASRITLVEEQNLQVLEPATGAWHTLTALDKTPKDICYSPVGDVLAVLYVEQAQATIQLRDVTDGSVRRELISTSFIPSGEIAYTALAFNADGSEILLMIVEGSNCLMQWLEVGTGDLLSTNAVSGLNYEAGSQPLPVALSQDGAVMAYRRSDAGHIFEVRDTRDASLMFITSVPSNDTAERQAGFALRADGTQLATAYTGDSGTTLEIHSFFESGPAREITSSPSSHAADYLEFSPDGQTLLVAGNTYNCTLLPLAGTGSARSIDFTWPGHINFAVNYFAPGGDLMVTRTRRRLSCQPDSYSFYWVVRTLSTMQFRGIWPLEQHLDPPTHLRYSQNGEVLLSRDQSGHSLLWETSPQRFIRRLTQTGESAVTSADGLELYDYVDGRLRVHNSSSGELQLAMDVDLPADIALIPDATLTRLYTAGERAVALFNLITRQVQFRTEIKGNPIEHLLLSPDGRRLIAFNDSTIHVVDADSGELLRTDRPANNERGQIISVSADGRYAFLFDKTHVGSSKPGAVVWDLSAGAVRHSLFTATSEPRVIALSLAAFTPNNDYLYLGITTEDVKWSRHYLLHLATGRTHCEQSGSTDDFYRQFFYEAFHPKHAQAVQLDCFLGLNLVDICDQITDVAEADHNPTAESAAPLLHLRVESGLAIVEADLPPNWPPHCELTLTSVLGQICHRTRVYTTQSSALRHTIDLHHLSKGMYIIELRGASRVAHGVIVHSD